MRVLVTAGPTREYFDSVRFISNASSGRMGYAIAAAAHARGHEVVLISGPVALPPPEGVRIVPVVSADDMLRAAEEVFADCDAAVMTAAVADFRPVERGKAKQEKPRAAHTVQLEPTPDICATLGRAKGARVVIGFALQDADPHARAEAKLARKQCSAIVLNDPEAIGRATVRLQWKIAGDAWSHPFTGSKAAAGARIIELAEQLHTASRRALPD